MTYSPKVRVVLLAEFDCSAFGTGGKNKNQQHAVELILSGSTGCKIKDVCRELQTLRIS